MISQWVPVLAAALCAVGAVAAALRFEKDRSIATGSFILGMLALCAESMFHSMSVPASSIEAVEYWEKLAIVSGAYVPAIWLAFSLSYSRGNQRGFLRKWRFVLGVLFFLPAALLVAGGAKVVSGLWRPDGSSWWVSLQPAARLLCGLSLVGFVLIVVNLEKTFRATIGMLRWRIKFFILGLVVVFGTRVYTRSQGFLFSGQDAVLIHIEAVALLIGGVLMAAGYARSGFAQVDVYPSHTVLRNSLTVLLAGGYLLIVGVLAQVVRYVGSGGDWLRVEAFFVLLALALLGLLLLSDRLRQRLGDFISRHFQRPQYDSMQVWAQCTGEMSRPLDQVSLCRAGADLISDQFRALSVTIWVNEAQRRRIVFGASTSSGIRASEETALPEEESARVLRALQGRERPFEIEDARGDLLEPVREPHGAQFRSGRPRLCVPLCAGEQLMGFAVIADRVNGIPFTAEEFDLLRCIGGQLGANLLKVRLTDELVVAREWEAFQAISAFFVHDLKNTASSLTLMLQNLPLHYDVPEFRADALRGIENTVTRINQLISELGVLRNSVELKPERADLNSLVLQAIEKLNGVPGVEMEQELRPIPATIADGEQIQSVVTNLLLNAREAVGGDGRIRIETCREDDRAVLSVADNGCGMSPRFIEQSLFRPFKTTKKKGIGIGMFQSKRIVEAHGGNIQVESKPGFGTVFRVSLPLEPQSC